MQGLQNIPNPDVNSREIEDDFDSHSDYPDVDKTDVENSDVDNIPLPPDKQPARPVEEPRSDVEKPPINENEDAPKQIV